MASSSSASVSKHDQGQSTVLPQEDNSESTSHEDDIQQAQDMDDVSHGTKGDQAESESESDEEIHGTTKNPEIKSSTYPVADSDQKQSAAQTQEYFTTHLGTLYGSLISKTKLASLLSNEAYIIQQIPDRSTQHKFERDDKESEKEKRSKQLKKAREAKALMTGEPEVKTKSNPRLQQDSEKMVFSKSALFTINMWLEQAVIALNEEMVKNIKSINPQKKTRSLLDLDNVLSTSFDSVDAWALKSCAREAVDRLNVSYAKTGGEVESDSSVESD
jgi:hypothetical protein